MSCQVSKSPQLITVIPEEDHANLVDTIQETTRGYSHAQSLLTAFEWEWMAWKLRRVVAMEGGAVAITRLIERLPANERLALRKLCKIRGETFEEFTRFANWKAAQAIEVGAEDYAALAGESRSREAAIASKSALVTLPPPPEQPGSPGGPR